MPLPLIDLPLLEAEAAISVDQPPPEAIFALPDTLDQPLPEAEAAISDSLDQPPFEPVHTSFTLGDQQLSGSVLNGMALLIPGSLLFPQTSHYDYSHLWPDVDIEMSFSQAGCEWFVRTQEPQNNHRKDAT